MSEAAFTHDVFLSHSAEDKAVVRAMAKRLQKDGLQVWRDKWEIPVAASRQSAAFSPEGQEPEDLGALPSHRYAEKIEEGLGRSRFEFQPSAFILQPFLGAPIKGSLAQFLYIKKRGL
jgi:hypothetical protein